MKNLDDVEQVSKYITNVMKLNNLNAEILEDLSQEALIKVYTKYDQYEGRASLKSWISRVTRNTFLSEIRRPKYKREIKNYDDVHNPDRTASSVDLEKNYDTSKIFKCVLEKYEELPPRQKQVVGMHIFNEMKPKEIAEELDMKFEAVKSSIKYGLKNLREKVRKEGLL